MALSPRLIASFTTGGVAAIALFAVLYNGYQSNDAVRTDGASLQVVSAASRTEDTGGKIGELDKEFDMGIIGNDKETVQKLTIVNMGTGPLEIKDVRTSCGCTQGYFKDRGNDKIKTVKIAAGESAELFISVDPFRVPGFDSRKVLTLYTNDPDNRTVSMDVVAKVDPEFEIEPDQLHLGIVNKGNKAIGQAIVRQLDDSDFEVTAVRAGARANDTYTTALALRPESEWRTPGKREWTIDVAFDSNTLRKGLFRDRIYLETNSARLKIFSYMLNADIQTFYSVIPEMLHRRDAVAPGTKSVTSAVVTSEQPITVEGLTCSDPALMVVANRGNSQNTVVLDLSVAPDASPGVKNATLEFTIVAADGQRANHSLRAIIAVTRPNSGTSEAN